MPFIPRVGNAIAGISVPQSVQKMFLATSKDGPAAIAPLEGSVVVGRSIAETVRSGFLGLQERLVEESAAAIIWLWGVKFMQRLFDRLKPVIFPKGKHLSGEIAWSRSGQRTGSVDLTPQELFTRDAHEMKTLRQIKLLRLLFSTGVALGGVAYVVPKLNQLKTNWILKNFYEGKKPEPDGGQFVPSGVGRTMSMIAPAGVPNSAMLSNASPSATPALPTTPLRQPFPSFLSPSSSSSVSSPVQISSNNLEGLSPEPDGGRFVPSGVGRTMSMIAPAGVPNSAMSSNASPSTTPAIPTTPLRQPFQTFLSPSFSSSLEVPSLPSNPAGPAPHPNRGVFVPGGLGRPTQTIVSAGVPTSAMPFSASPTATPASLLPSFNGSRSNFQAPLFASVGIQNSTAKASIGNPLAKAPQFGLLGAPVSNLIQNVGYAIEHTSYGNILVVDNGIVLGRAHVANKRSKFEAVEVVFRDVVSLYFYMLFAPHVMKAFSSMLNPVFQTHLLLQPKVTEELTNAISKGLTERVQQWMLHEPDAAKREAMEAAFQRGAVPKDFVLEILSGSQNPLLLEPNDTLKKALRNATLDGPQGLSKLFQQEMMTYGWSDEQMKHWNMQVQRFMRHSSPTHWSTTELERLLAAVQQGHTYFEKLTESQRKEMVVALKNAFRHTVGIQVDLSGKTLKLNGQPLEKAHAFSKVWPQLTTEEQMVLTHRLRRMAEIDGLNQVSTLWRRSLNLLRESIGEHSTLMSQGEMLAGWVDRAVSHHLTLSELLTREMTALKDALQERGLIKPDEALTPEKLRDLSYNLQVQKGVRKLAQQVENLKMLLGSASAHNPLDIQLAERMESLLGEMLSTVDPTSNNHSILTQYQQMIHERLSGTRGQLFSLAVADGDVMLDAKLKDLLVGGLQNDSTFLKNAQNIVGDLIVDPRNFKNSNNLQKLRTSIEQYGDKLMNYLDQESVSAVEDMPKLVSWGRAGGAAETFQKLNRNLNYMGRTISMAGAMLCLGVLVPKTQYLITRKLTGRDENPGISSAERNLGIQHRDFGVNA